MVDTEPVTFKTEDSMWQLMAEGKKTWDARLFDIDDERFHRLLRGRWEIDPVIGRQPYYLPKETLVRFLNKATEELLQFRFRGLQFVEWAPGWCFIQLGGLVCRYEADGVPRDLEERADALEKELDQEEELRLAEED